MFSTCIFDKLISINTALRITCFFWRTLVCYFICIKYLPKSKICALVDIRGINYEFHCVKSVRIQSFSDPHFPTFSVFSPKAGKYGPEKLQNALCCIDKSRTQLDDFSLQLYLTHVHSLKLKIYTFSNSFEPI